MNPAVVATQVLGPAGELHYFTSLPPGKSKFGLGSATSFVDRIFIVVLAQAWGLPPAHPFPIAIVRLPERFLVEVDEYPVAAASRATATGELPPGMAMVSFTVPSLEPFLSRFVAPPRAPDGVPYAGRRVGVLLGPSGEHIELIEAGPAPDTPGSGP